MSKSAQGADSGTLHNEDKRKKRQQGTTPTLIYPPQKLRSNNSSSFQVHANDWNDDEGLLLLLSMHGRPLGNKKHQTSASQHSLKISSSTVHHPQTWAIAMAHVFITEWETAISGVWHQSRQNTCLQEREEELDRQSFGIFQLVKVKQSLTVFILMLKTEKDVSDCQPPAIQIFFHQ